MRRQAPAQYCAPRLDEGFAVAAVRQRIALRAGLVRSAEPGRSAALRGYVDGSSRRSPRATLPAGRSTPTPGSSGLSRHLCGWTTVGTGAGESLSCGSRRGRSRQRLPRFQFRAARGMRARRSDNRSSSLVGRRPVARRFARRCCRHRAAITESELGSTAPCRGVTYRERAESGSRIRAVPRSLDISGTFCRSSNCWTSHCRNNS